MSAIFAQRLTRPLASLDETWRHVHETFKSAYKGLVRPVLEYGSSVWDPQSILLQDELYKVQERAARFVTGNYIYETGSMTGILEQLKWESLKKRRKDSRLIMLYKGLKGAASIVYPQMTLFPQSGVPGIITPWHSKSQWLGLIQVQFLPPDYKRLELLDRFPYLCF